MIIPMPIPFPMGGDDSSNTAQIKPFQITEIEYSQSKKEQKRGYGAFEKYKKYDVLAVDSEMFLVVDDNKNFIWIDYQNCKAT